MVDKLAIKDHEEWIKKNCKNDVMRCQVCGTLVSKHWMITELTEKARNYCGPCYFKD